MQANIVNEVFFSLETHQRQDFILETTLSFR